MREKNRNSIASCLKLPQFTTMNVIDGQAGLVLYSSLIFYSLTIDNILNISASPSSKADDTVSSITIDITIDDTVNITSSSVYSAWSQSPDETDQTISSSSWKKVTLTSNGDKQEIGQITSSQATDGDWYLYIKAVINGKEEIQHFGEYKFQAKPTVDNLVCKKDSISADNTTATLEVGSNKAFEGWTVSYQIVNDEKIVKAYSDAPLTIIPGTTIKTVTVTKGDIITVKYSKSGETDVTKTVNADTFDLTLTAAMIEFRSTTDETTDQAWAAIDNVADALDYLYQHLNTGSASE